MNKETLAALRESIAHWRELAQVSDYSHIQIGAKNCALCQLFHPIYRSEQYADWDDCSACPVAQRTGERLCQGTPYTSVSEGLDNELGLVTFRLRAQRELDFLISLLPEGEE